MAYRSNYLVFANTGMVYASKPVAMDALREVRHLRTIGLFGHILEINKTRGGYWETGKTITEQELEMAAG